MKNRALEAVCAELDAAGIPYEIDRTGKHTRIVFGGHVQIVPSTPGDSRGWLNARALVRRMLRSDGLSALAQREAAR